MPNNQYPLHLAAAGMATDAFLVETGFLVGVSMWPQDIGIDAHATFGQIWLGSSATPTPIPVILLCSGYIDTTQAISWTGSILLDPGSVIIPRVWSQLTSNYRLSVLTQKEA